MAEDRNTYKIHDNGSLGEVQIADEVVAIIAGLAATEVDGVGSKMCIRDSCKRAVEIQMVQFLSADAHVY